MDSLISLDAPKGLLADSRVSVVPHSTGYVLPSIAHPTFLPIVAAQLSADGEPENVALGKSKSLFP